MWKPFLARSLRSVYGGRRHHAVPPGGADRIFSRAYACWKREAGGGGEGTSQSNCHHQQPLLPHRRHLYVVLRDRKREHEVYTFHKLNLDDALEDMNGGASQGNGAQNLRRLPEPIARIGTGGVGTDARFHALGSNILITGAGHNNNGLTLLYNTDRGLLDVAGDLPHEIWPYDFAAAGGKLHALQAPYYLSEEHWSWEDGDRSGMPSFCAVGARITAQAVHPDGRTVFVSADYFNKDKADDTFSLDTESGQWTHRGNWRLPFHGQGHCDGDLEGWVGVARSTDGGSPCDYYLCSCDVPAVADSPAPPPAWKLGKEKLTFIEAPVSTIGHAPPVLVHTGHGRFCLVETASLERATPGRRCSCDACGDDRSSIQLHVTMFRSKYRKNGELVVAPAPRAARSYEIPSGTSFDGPAFWM